jgi:hypothetical protein
VQGWENGQAELVSLSWTPQNGDNIPWAVSDGDGQFTLPIPFRNYSLDALRRTGSLCSRPCLTSQALYSTRYVL